jgi:hypothetical protein
MLVMPAFVAGIRIFLGARQIKSVDGRNKSGHDAADELQSRAALPLAQASTPAPSAFASLGSSPASGGGKFALNPPAGSA